MITGILTGMAIGALLGIAIVWHIASRDNETW